MGTSCPALIWSLNSLFSNACLSRLPCVSFKYTRSTSQLHLLIDLNMLILDMSNMHSILGLSLNQVQIAGLKIVLPTLEQTQFAYEIQVSNLSRDNICDSS